MLVQQAYAKLNLYLHILGRRPDGYHDMESLVAFTQLADTLRIAPSSALSLRVTGEFAHEAGQGDANLVLRAAAALGAHANRHAGAAMELHKNIPVGAGLGGGSADAAAALRGLNAHWKLGLTTRELQAIGATLGADVPACIEAIPVMMCGMGTELVPIKEKLPPLYVLLVHPRVPLLTKEVYAALDLSGLEATGWREAASISPAVFLESLLDTRNHLQRAAITVRPEVAELLLALETLQPAPDVVRMSGSGACCFALYTAVRDCETAARTMRAQYPHWWVHSTALRR